LISALDVGRCHHNFKFLNMVLNALSPEALQHSYGCEECLAFLNNYARNLTQRIREDPGDGCEECLREIGESLEYLQQYGFILDPTTGEIERKQVNQDETQQQPTSIPKVPSTADQQHQPQSQLLNPDMSRPIENVVQEVHAGAGTSTAAADTTKLDAEKQVGNKDPNVSIRTEDGGVQIEVSSTPNNNNGNTSGAEVVINVNASESNDAHDDVSEEKQASTDDDDKAKKDKKARKSHKTNERRSRSSSNKRRDDDSSSSEDDAPGPSNRPPGIVSLENTIKV
jgi:hypothetical protein